MFGNVRRVYEARIEDLKEAHDARCKEMLRTIDALAEQIEYLRLTAGRPSPQQPANPTDQPVRMAQVDPWVNEDEEEILAAQQAGIISTVDAEDALAQIGFINKTIQPAQ